MSFLTIRIDRSGNPFDLIDALGFFEPSVELGGEDRPLRLKGEIVAPDGFIVGKLSHRAGKPDVSPFDHIRAVTDCLGKVKILL